MTWWDDPDATAAYLRQLAAVDGVRLFQDSSGPFVDELLPMPVGGPQGVAVRVQDDTLRAVAHQVVSGPVNGQALANHTVVNEAPYAGCAYPSADGTATDLSVGLPLPAERPGSGGALVPPLRDLLGMVRSGAAQLRGGLAPEHTGPRGPDPATMLRQATEALLALGHDVTSDRDRADLVLDVDGTAYAVVVYPVGAAVLAARAVPLVGRRVDADDDVLRRFGAWNREAAAGAAGWSSVSRAVHGVCSFPPGVVPVSARSVGWLVHHAATAASAAHRLVAVPVPGDQG